jgi:small multidrug resistance pump
MNSFGEMIEWKMLSSGHLNNSIYFNKIHLNYSMSLISSYLFLGLAVILGVTSNSFAKSAEGFTLLFPSIITGITIVMCMYALSMVMKNIPMGITYASFAGLTIIATVIVGIFRFNQIPNLYSLIGLALIIAGVVMVNMLGSVD